MADARFYSRSGPFTLAQLAERTGAVLKLAASGRNASAGASILDVASLDRASGEEISFLDNVKYLELLSGSKAAACFLRPKFAEKAPAGMALLLTEDPYRCYAKAAQGFYPTVEPPAHISPDASVSSKARIGKGCSIAPGAVIEEGAEIGECVSIGPGAHISKGVVIGENSRIGAHCTLYCCLIGARAILHPGVHIGQDGFGFAMGREGHLKVPQLGRVVIEDDVEIGAGTCIDRGSGPDTHIGAGTKIDNLVQIGHNVQIGRNCVIVAQVGIAGSTRIGDGVVLAGQAGIAGHLRIGSGAKVAAQGGVMSDIPPGAAFGGSPAVPVKDWHRQNIALGRLIKKDTNEDE